MIEYIIPNNIDDRVLVRACQHLEEGSLIAFPTDTSWVVVCDPFKKKGVEALYRFKGEERSKHFSLLYDSISKASEAAVIEDFAFGIIRKRVPGHYTFIFQATKKITKAIKASKSDHQVGIRIPPCPVSESLIKKYEMGLLSTNIGHGQLGIDEGEEIYSYLIEEKLGHQLAMILDPGEYEFVGQSTIIDLSREGEIELLRAGAGDTNFIS